MLTNWVPFSTQPGTKSNNTASQVASCKRAGISISAIPHIRCSAQSTGNDNHDAVIINTQQYNASISI
jgi:hypothetical protein